MTIAAAIIDTLRPVRFRGKMRVLGPLTPHSGEATAVVFGSRVRLDLSDLMQREIYVGAYERGTTAAVKRHLQRGQAFLDVGANVGYFTLLAAHCVGRTGRVVAAEPSPPIAELLETTLRENHLEHVHLYRVGLGAAPSNRALVVPLPGNHTPSFYERDANRARELVPVVTLDDALPSWFPADEPIALLKADIEGGELDLVRGGQRTLAAGRVWRVLIEENDAWLRAAGGSTDELRRLLGSLGFGIEEEPGDNMVLWRHRAAP